MSNRKRSLRQRASGPSARRTATITDADSPRIAAALRCWESGQRDDALTLFQEAIHREPNNLQTYVTAARACAQKFDFEAMEVIHQQLRHRAPRHPAVSFYLAETYRQLNLPDKAAEHYRQAAACGDGSPVTRLELAVSYERAHRLDEAEDQLDRAVRSGIAKSVAQLIRGRIQRRRNCLEQAESTLRDAASRVVAEEELAGEIWGEIALVKDAQRDFDGATEAILRCKRQQSMRQQPWLAGSERAHDATRELLGSVSKLDFQRWRAAADAAPIRTALLTGFPRSGTTLLEQALDAHPEIVSSEERDFIGQEFIYSLTAHNGAQPLLDLLHGLTDDAIAREQRRYVAAMEYLLGEPIAGRLHIDKNPAYNAVIAPLLRLFPHSRIIVALRDPRDVVLSCYLRYMPLNFVSVWFLSPEKTAQKYAQDMGVWLQLRQIIGVPWREVRYEDLVANFAAEVRETISMLGLTWNDQVLNYRDRIDAGKRVTSPSYEAVAQPVYTQAVGRWRNYERLLEPALAALEPFVCEFGYKD